MYTHIHTYISSTFEILNSSKPRASHSGIEFAAIDKTFDVFPAFCQHTNINTSSKLKHVLKHNCAEDVRHDLELSCPEAPEREIFTKGPEYKINTK